jgi:hypothetical protein
MHLPLTATTRAQGLFFWRPQCRPGCGGVAASHCRGNRGMPVNHRLRHPHYLASPAPNTDAKESKLQPVAFVMLGLLVSGTVLAAETRPRGPDGFGNIPYGSSSRDAVRLNHGKGQVIHDSDRPILTYRTSIEGLRFDVKQNYDQSGKAVDAIAISILMEAPRDCVGQFNHVLSILQAAYGQSGSAPLKGRIDEREIRYTVLFQFDRKAGIEAEVTLPDPSSRAPIAGNSSGSHRGSNRVGRCLIRLHYLPTGWVGHL